MSYNIMGKNASFKGDVSGTIENQVNDWDDQSISGNKTFTAAITSSADVMLSGSGKVSASFFYGDGTGLSGVGGTPGGSDREVQFNNSSAFGASANFKFTAANELQVTGQISASLGVSGSEFHGDGSNLSAVTASFVTASNVNGTLRASQIILGTGLEDDSNAVQINLSGSTSGLSIDSDGLQLDVATLGADGSYSNTKAIIVQDGANPPKRMELSAVEAAITVRASNVSSTGGSLDNSTMPTNISITSLTASTHISASTFHGDGSALEGVTATPTPAGSNTQIQFNNGGSLAGDADLTFLTGSNTLATTIVSASAHISASSYAIAGGTIINADANISCGEITMQDGSGVLNFGNNQISGSGNISGSQFYGDGTTLSGVPLNTSVANGVVHVANAPSKTITTDSNFTYNGSDLVLVNGDFKINTSGDVHVINGNVTASGHVSASTYYGDGSNLTGIGGSTTTEFHVATNSILAQAGKKFIPLSPSAGGSTMNSRANFTSIFHNNKNFLQWIAPASGSIKQITVNLTDPSTLYSIPLGTGGDTTISKDNIIFMLYKNNNDTSLTANTVGEITASAGDYSISSSVGRIFTIPCDTGLFSGSSTFDPGDVLKMGGYLPNANGGSSADAEILITYELSGSDV